MGHQRSSGVSRSLEREVKELTNLAGLFFLLKFRLFPELCPVELLVTDQASTLTKELLENFPVPFPSPVIKGVFLLPKYPQTDGQGLQTRQMSRSVSCASPP